MLLTRFLIIGFLIAFVVPPTILAQNVVVNPTANQNIAQPSSTVFTSNRIGQKRMADQFNWSQSPTSPTTLAVGANTVTLSPCPAGFLNTINGSNSNHWIYVDSAAGDAQQPGEPVLITAESCLAGSASGTITFSVGYAHGSRYMLESGTGGIKEASVDANQVRYDTVRGNDTWIEVTPNATTEIKAPLYWQTAMGRLQGTSLLECWVNMSCINVGDTDTVRGTVSTSGTSVTLLSGSQNNFGTLVPNQAIVINGVGYVIALVGSVNSLTLTTSAGTQSSASWSAYAFAVGNANTYYNNIVDGFSIRPNSTMVFWDVAPSSPSSITAGGTSQTLTIPTCPAGFWPLIPNQILWLNGTTQGLVGTAYEDLAPGPGEFVRVTGGTCTPGASAGTIIVVPAIPRNNAIAGFAAHDAGYTLSNGATAYIEDNSQGTVISNIQTSGWTGAVGYGFVIQNDNNQGELVTNVNTYGGLRCDAAGTTTYTDFCGATLFAPGPNLLNAGITKMIGGTSQNNCAVWYSGNDFELDGPVCQAYNNYGLFLSVKRGGSLQRARATNVHFERGNVSNSLATGLGAATMIVQGYNVVVDGNGEQTTSFPQFSVPSGNNSGDALDYYISIVDTTDSIKTSPIPIGYATPTTDPSANNVTVKWVTADCDQAGCPNICPNPTSGKCINFEIYRVDGTALSGNFAGIAPYPGLCDGLGSDGKCLVAQGLSPAAYCDIHGVCAFTDNVAPASLGAATIQTTIAGTGWYSPYWSFTPGGVVLTAGATYQGDPSCLIVNSPWMAATSSVSTVGSPPSSCMGSSSAINNALWQIPASIGGVYTQSAIILADRTNANDGGHAVNLKGRINFLGQGTTPRCVTTWWDANPAKTLSTKTGGETPNYFAVNRPVWDFSDVCTGVDGSGSLFEMFPTSMHFYANDGTVLPNSSGTNWTEAITATGHIFTNHLNQGATGTFAGTCSMSASTSCIITLTAAFSSTPGCLATVQGTTPIAGACSVSGTTVTVTASSSNSDKWAAMLFGNPN